MRLLVFTNLLHFQLGKKNDENVPDLSLTGVEERLSEFSFSGQSGPAIFLDFLLFFLKKKN